MSLPVNTKKYRNMIITCALLVAVSVALVIIGMNQYENIPMRYTSPEDGAIDFYMDDGKYYLNEVQLEVVEIGWWQRAINALEGFMPALPYIVAVFFCMFLLTRLLGKVPPPLLWGSFFGKHNSKEISEGKVSLKQAPGGIIALRGWDVDKAGILHSTAQGDEWESAAMESDVTPLVGGWHGLYAYRLGTEIDNRGNVRGIVSLSGKITGHKDSLLRAQKCTILVLLLEPKRAILKPLLEQRYKCPVVVTSNIKHTLQNWVLSREGVFWLGHNAKLISNKLQDKLEHDIEELPAYQEFGGES